MAQNTKVNLVSEKGRKLTAEEHDETIGNLKATADEAHNIASAALPADGMAADSAKLGGKTLGTAAGEIPLVGDFDIGTAYVKNFGTFAENTAYELFTLSGLNLNGVSAIIEILVASRWGNGVNSINPARALFCVYRATNGSVAATLLEHTRLSSVSTRGGFCVPVVDGFNVIFPWRTGRNGTSTFTQGLQIHVRVISLSTAAPVFPTGATIFPGAAVLLSSDMVRTDSAQTLSEKKIQFANANDANPAVLDWYEEGTFTPTLRGTNVGGVVTYSVQQGRYTRIGNRVFFSCVVDWTATTGTGSMFIGGLPFVSSSANPVSQCNISSSRVTFNGALSAFMPVSMANIYPQVFTSGGNPSYLEVQQSGRLTVSGSYEV